MQPVYSFENILHPVWDTDTVWFESVMLVQEDGNVSAPLLYEPTRILTVQSADLTVTYAPGRDYEYRDGRIWLTEDSRIFRFRREELYPAEPIPGHSFPMEGGNVLFYEGHYFHDRQIAVTYRCEKGGWPGAVPGFVGEHLPRTMELLRQKKPLKLVLYGDSISEGANASGFTGTSPFLPTWGQLTAEKLRRHYDCPVTFENPSKGGMDAVWGAENVVERVCSREPDLVMLHFGCNDGIAGEEFRRRIRNILEPIHRNNPNAEVMLIACIVPNPLLRLPAARFYNQQYRQQDDLASFVGEGTAMVSMYAVQQTLLRRKRFIDLTGNNVNHPNDFMVRLYAQTLNAALIP